MARTTPASDLPTGDADYIFGMNATGRGRKMVNKTKTSATALLADTTLGSADLPIATGDIVTAGGAAYEVVADPGVSVPKRMMQTAAAAPVTLKFAGSARMDITAFGAVEGSAGAAATTKALDSAMAEAAYWQRSVSDVVGSYPLTADGPAVYIPAGRWYYEGAGLDRTTTTSELRAKAYAIRGEHRGASIIINKSDCYLLKTSDTNALTFEHFSLIGGKGLWVGQETAGNVRGGIYANNLLIKNFTECALGHNSTDFPFISVTHCQIEGVVTSNVAQALYGLCFPGLSDEVFISNNSIGGVRYGIKLTQGGNHAKVVNNGIFGRPNQSGGMSADIWIVPRSTETNAGQGLIIDGNKFGPEGIENTTVARILFADEDTTNTYSWQRPHSTVKSTGYAVGARISKNDFGGNNNHRDSLIYSTTYRLNGLDFTPDNSITGFAPTKLVEYSSDVLTDYAGNSLQIRSGGRMSRSNAGVVTPAAGCKPRNMRGAFVPIAPDFGGCFEGAVDTTSGWGSGDPADYQSLLDVETMTYSGGTATGSIADPFGGHQSLFRQPDHHGLGGQLHLRELGLRHLRTVPGAATGLHRVDGDLCAPAIGRGHRRVHRAGHRLQQL